MSNVEQPPQQISAEWRRHRQQATPYYGSLRNLWYGLTFSLGALAISAMGISLVTQTVVRNPESLARVVGGSFCSLALVVVGLYFGYVTLTPRYLVSPTGFELRELTFSVFAPWEQIVVVTEPGFDWLLIIGVEFRPPQFEPTWLVRIMPWAKPDAEEQVMFSCVCDYRAASRAALGYAKTIEKRTERTSGGGA